MTLGAVKKLKKFKRKMKIEKYQLWVRKIDHCTVVVDDVVKDYVQTHERNNEDEKGFYRVDSFLEHHYLMGIDDVVIEVGGIF